MRQGPNNRRSRGRNNNAGGRRPSLPNRNQTFDSNGPDVRIRGNAYQVHEKYLGLARDASAAGDRVMAENYLQHAEHYFRIVNAINEAHHQAFQQQQQQQPFDGGRDGQREFHNRDNGGRAGRDNGGRDNGGREPMGRPNGSGGRDVFGPPASTTADEFGADPRQGDGGDSAEDVPTAEAGSGDLLAELGDPGAGNAQAAGGSNGQRLSRRRRNPSARQRHDDNAVGGGNGGLDPATRDGPTDVGN